MNKLNKLKQVAKRNYIKQELDKRKYDMAKLWKTINEITCPQKCHNSNPSALILITTWSQKTQTYASC